MKQTPEIQAMLAAHEALRAAEDQLKEAVEQAFPIGDEVIYIYTRNGRQYALVGEVIAHGYDPGYIVIKNIETGKKRKIHAPFEVKNGGLE